GGHDFIPDRPLLSPSAAAPAPVRSPCERFRDCVSFFVCVSPTGIGPTLTEKPRDLPPLMPVFLRFGDFQEMRDRRIGRAAAGLLMPELAPQERICRLVVP